jgi:hypothetical protein
VQSLLVYRRISTRLIRVVSQVYRRDRLLGLSRRQIITRLVGSQGSRVRGLLVRMRIGTGLVGSGGSTVPA